MFEKIAFAVMGAILSLLGTYIFHRWSNRQRELNTLKMLDEFISAVRARLYDNLDVSQKDLWAAELEAFVAGPRMPVFKIGIPLREISKRIRSNSCSGQDPIYDPDKLLADLWVVRLATLSKPAWFDFRLRRRAKQVLGDFLTNAWGMSGNDDVEREYNKWVHGELRLGSEFAAADLINRRDQ